MPRRLVLALAALAALAAAGVSTASTVTDAPDARLEASLGRALAVRDIDPRLTAALVIDAETGQVVFQQNVGRSLAPASAEKLTVAFAALRLLGPGYRFRTEVLGSGQLVGHVWDGDLYLVGFGDPTLETSDLASLARDVATWGIRCVSGRIVADEGFYDRHRGARGWKPSFLGIESHPLSALEVGDTPGHGMNGSALAAAAVFRKSLARRGITVARISRRGHAPADTFPLALHFSEPLATIAQTMNTDSDNYIAEMLVKQLGASLAGQGTTLAGVRVVRHALGEAGVPLGGVRLVDGSGLSLLDRVTVKALVTILRIGASDPDIRSPFLSSLAVAGVSGTLEHRLRRRLTRGRVIAKTGTTDEASALAGIVRRRYVFAILQNGSPVDYWSAREAQDRFVMILARASRPQPPSSVRRSSSDKI